jgi:beta-lactamase class A
MGSAVAAEVPAPPPAPPAPAEVQEAVDALAKRTRSHVGVAVKDLQDGWIAAYQGDTPFPQQSVIKIWLGIAVLDAVDRGELALDEVVMVRREDLSLFNQPMKPLVLRAPAEGYPITIGQLLVRSLTQSDNAATDILMRRLGQGAAVQKVLDAKGLHGVRVGVQERMLQPSISGLRWTPEYSNLGVFNQARQAVPAHIREAAFTRYVDNPLDGATPVGAVNGLEDLKEGRLLSPASTQRLLSIMSESRAGARRLRAGLKPGWLLSHKTGTGPDWNGETAGYNDVGVLVAPDGRAYAVAVYMGRTGIAAGERRAFMSSVARTVVEHWEATHGAGVERRPDRPLETAAAGQAEAADAG